MRDDAPLRAAIAAVERAGEYALRQQGRRPRVHVKADLTPVTEVDRKAEEIIRRMIARAFPGDGFLGEEFGEERPGAEARWILDPIDGTKSYIRGLPFWGTLLAREVGNRLTLGVIGMPAMGKLAWAARGRGAFCGRRRLRTSSRRRLSGSLVLTGDADGFVRHGTLNRVSRLARRGAIVRALSDCQAYLWIAGGNADAMIEPVISPWDVAAAKIVVEEAGGRFTGWRGERTYAVPRSVASNGHLHPALLRVLR